MIKKIVDLDTRKETEGTREEGHGNKPFLAPTIGRRGEVRRRYPEKY